jgi:cell division protein FtsA
MDIKSEIVDDKDIGDVLGACIIPSYEIDREILHAQPVNFSLDHRTGLSDPRGQIGKHLSVDMHLLTIKEKTIQDLAYCIKRCDLELAGVASSSYVSALSSLVEDEKELGAACVDLGGGSTNISIFWKKHMIFAETIKMGGELVTRDISMGLQVPLSAAERIKTRNGGVVATGIDDREMIEISSETGDWELDRRIISRSDLIGIMRPRIEEILEEVRASLDNAGFDDLPSQKIVLTGGASQVPGIESLANKILGQQVRLGRPMRIHRLPQAYSGPTCAGLVGLSLFAAHPQDEWWDFSPRSKNFSGQSVSRVFRWFKDNW